LLIFHFNLLEFRLSSASASSRSFAKAESGGENYHHRENKSALSFGRSFARFARQVSSLGWSDKSVASKMASAR